MLQKESILIIADNSGVKRIKIIGCRSSKTKIGELVTASVKVVNPTSNFKKGDKVKALIISTKSYFHRKSNNTWIKFSKNAAILIKKEELKPFGTRIFFPIMKELMIKYNELSSLSPEIL